MSADASDTRQESSGSPPVPPRVRGFWSGLGRLLLGDWRPTRRFGLTATIFAVICAAITVLVWHGFAIGDPDRWFHEGKWATVLSAVMLGVAAFFSFRTAEWYADADTRSFWLGFGVLLAIAAIDEGFKLHEHIDIWTHQILGLDRDNSKLSSLDSWIMLVYPVAMAVISLRSWRHVLALTSFLRWAAFGGVGFFVMALLDLYVIKLPTPADGDILWEELVKSLAVASLLAGVVHVQPRFRRPGPNRPVERS